MNRTIKHIIGCLATLAMVAVGTQKLGFWVRPMGENNTDSAYTQIDTFYSLPDNSVEVIIYGSSHAFRNVDPMVMYEKYGIGAYNYSWHWQKINTTKLFLQDSLLSQSPRVAAIETFFAGRVLEDVDMNGEIYYTRYLRDSKYRRQYLKQCFGNDTERWLSYYMPLAAFHDNWANLTQRSFSPIVNRHNYRMGFGATEGSVPVELPDPASVKQKKLKQEALAELDEIVELCKSRGIEVLFFTVPYQDGDPYTDAMAAYAAQKGCAYINLFEHVEECGIDPATDFKDKGHLNTNGAVKVGAFLGKYLSEHYDLTDMRQVADNPWSRAQTVAAED